MVRATAPYSSRKRLSTHFLQLSPTIQNWDRNLSPTTHKLCSWISFNRMNVASLTSKLSRRSVDDSLHGNWVEHSWMKHEGVCVYVTDRWMGLWVYLGLLSFIFPLLFDLTCYLLFPFFTVIHTLAPLQTLPQIFEWISADVTEKNVCALWELSSSHHKCWPCALDKIHKVQWCGLESRTWPWWRLDAAKHQQIHTYTYFNGCKEHSYVTFYKYNSRSEISLEKIWCLIEDWL